MEGKTVLRPILFGLITISTAAAAPGAFASGEIVINEITAAPSERLLRWSPAAFPPEPDTAWLSPHFDDSAWSEAPGGFGYGDEDRYDYTVVDIRSASAVSLYLRRTFTVPAGEAASNDPLQLVVDYDDGYVAYLNGVEVARRNLGRRGEFVSHNRTADIDHEAGIPETETLQAASVLLAPGTNVLAIQVHNNSLQSSDLALIADLSISGTPVRHLVRHDETWRYLVGASQPPGLYSHFDFSSVATLGAGVSWTSPQFDDSSWNQGPGKLGFGDGDENTIIDVRTLATSLYFRRSFAVTSQQASFPDPLELIVDYDDGFVAYLNGNEIVRKNLGSYGGFVYHDQTAFLEREATAAVTFILRAPASSLLTPGTNVLAIQVHNFSIDDYDLSLAADLRITGATVDDLVRQDDVWKYSIGTSEPSGGWKDEDEEFSDWIELYNPGVSSVSLNGWSLTDDPALPDKWILPDVTLNGGQYLVVFASGKDRRVIGGTPLHTNFKLDRGGEYLALFDAASPRQAVWAFSPNFPVQSPFHSYGRYGAGGEYRYFDTPTPGGPNTAGQSFTGFVADPAVNVNSGFYEQSFFLVLSCDTPDAVIRYTTDGREPVSPASPIYTGPIRIDGGTVVQARAFKDGFMPSRVVTRTYLVGQSAAVKSLPALSLVGDPQRDLFEPYGILAIVGGTYGNISDWCIDCWIPQGEDDYHHPLQRGRAFERPVTIDFLDPSNDAGFEVDCGIRVSGGTWIRWHLLRQEDWTRFLTKSSFRLYFRGDYGEKRLEHPLFPGARVEDFDVLTLRAGLNDFRNPFYRDELLRRLHIDMGHIGSHGIFANLFLNGDYKGYYNAVERLDEEFFRSWYESEEDWDVLRGRHGLLEPEIGSGDTVEWE